MLEVLKPPVDYGGNLLGFSPMLEVLRPPVDYGGPSGSKYFVFGVPSDK